MPLKHLTKSKFLLYGFLYEYAVPYVISLEIFAKLLTSDSSVVSTKNFILRTPCLAALGLCQQAKYCAVKKIFLVFHFFYRDVATFVFIRVSAWDIFAVGQNLVL